MMKKALTIGIPAEIMPVQGQRTREERERLYTKLMHDKGLRLVGGLLGSLLMSVAINVFIVPQGLYAGGAYGLCQVIRTLLASKLGVETGFDLAGVLYFFVNIPLFLLAFRALGRTFCLRAAVCTVSNSVFLALIPSPAVPIIPDPLTSCMIGGILVGFSAGLVLTCGCSTGGLDVLGLYLSKKGTGFTVGRFSIAFNAILYALCAVLFDLNTAIYSAIYMVFSSLFLDRVHQQNISVQMLIFTKEDPKELSRTITEKLERGFTFWEGQGGYSHEQIHVLCVCLSKYEVLSLQMALHEIDPHAFFVIQEGVRVGGNFDRHLSS